MALAAEEDLPLVQAIRKISRALHALEDGGLNRQAIEVLLVQQTKLSRKTVGQVLDGLLKMEKAFAQTRGATR